MNRLAYGGWNVLTVHLHRGAYNSMTGTISMISRLYLFTYKSTPPPHVDWSAAANSVKSVSQLIIYTVE